MDLDMWLTLLGLFKLMIFSFLRAKEDRVFGGLTCTANVLSIRVNRKGQSIRDGCKKVFESAQQWRQRNESGIKIKFRTCKRIIVPGLVALQLCSLIIFCSFSNEIPVGGAGGC